MLKFIFYISYQNKIIFVICLEIEFHYINLKTNKYAADERKNTERFPTLVAASDDVGSTGFAVVVGASGSAVVVGASGSAVVVGASGSAVVVVASGSADVVGSSGFTDVVGSSGSTDVVGSSGFTVVSPSLTLITAALPRHRNPIKTISEAYF